MEQSGPAGGLPCARPAGLAGGGRPVWEGKQAGDRDFGYFLVDADVEFEFTWNSEGVVSVS